MAVRLLLLAGVVLAVGFAPAPLPKRDSRKDLRSTLLRMQGWWAIVSEVNNGQPGRGPASGLRLLVKDDTLRYYIREQPADGWTITVKDGPQPPELDKMAHGSAPGTKPTYPSRIQVEGEILEIAWSGNDRPPDLSGARGTAIKFRRER